TGPPLPRLVARRRGSHAIVDYRFRAWPAAKGRRPWQVLVSIKGAGHRFPPLTARRAIRGPAGRVEQRLGLGRGPFRVLVSVRSRNGARSGTASVPLR
ncbi:MAG: hypothetical protein M3N16_07980, partial [Actinomycetota bacterium]|nr:hypothetical protein [Actinomycetota bacterium]